MCLKEYINNMLLAFCLGKKCYTINITIDQPKVVDIKGSVF